MLSVYDLAGEHIMSINPKDSLTLIEINLMISEKKGWFAKGIKLIIVSTGEVITKATIFENIPEENNIIWAIHMICDYTCCQLCGATIKDNATDYDPEIMEHHLCTMLRKESCMLRDQIEDQNPQLVQAALTNPHVNITQQDMERALELGNPEIIYMLKNAL